MEIRWRERRSPVLAVLLACALGLALMASAFAAQRAEAAVGVSGLTVDRTVEPLGTDVASSAPRLGWKLSSADRGVRQSSYRVLVATRADLLVVGRADVWDSGVVSSSASVDVRYGGPALASKTRYWWTVQVSTTASGTSAWATPTWWETGLRDGAAAPGWAGIEQRAATGADRLESGSVGQTFTAAGTFSKASGMFVEYGTGNPSGLTLSLYSGRGPGGRLLASRSFSNVRTDVWLDVDAPAGTPFPAGDYYLVAHDLRTSGDGMLGWWGHTNGSTYPDGTSYINGVASATDRLFRVVPTSGDELTDWTARWIELPSDWARPIMQGRATGADQLTGSSLGQTFTADKPFATAEGRFVEFGTGNPSSLRLSLYSGGPGGTLVASRTFSSVVTDRWLALDNGAGRTFPAGDYYLVATDLRTSGDGMLGWWGTVDGSAYAGGTAYTNGSPATGDRLFRVTIPEQAPPTLRKQVTLGSGIARARAYVSALGLYELRINGRRIGEDLYAPGWTDYARRVKFQTFDVTSALQSGANTIGATLADGWYSGTVGAAGRYLYGSQPAFIMQLEVTYTDGRTATVVTDTSWKGTREGPLRDADLYMGETYDARKELGAWSENGYDDSGWTSAVGATETGTDAPRVPQTHPETKAHATVPAVSVRSLGSGRYVFDLGREIAGVVRLEISGTAGQQVTLRHAPRLQSSGELDVGMLRSARATDVYTLKGGGTEVYQPRFTLHGFRYVEVSGLTAAPTTAMVSGVPVNADVRSVGSFSSGDRLVDELQSVLRATHLSHFVTIPFDTPERDERLGWVGEPSVSGGGLLFNYDIDTFLAAWAEELRYAQRPNGQLPHVVPFVPLVGDGGAYATDAIVHVPYLLWQRYGETRTLERLWPAMVAWIEQLRASAGGGLLGSASYADHLNLDEPTPGGVIENANYVRAARMMSEIATELGKSAAAADYASLAASLRTAYQSAYIAGDGRVSGDSQAGYAIAIAFDLVPPALRDAAGARLARKIADRGGYLVTGYSGTPYVLQALTATGQHATAESLILRDQYPSWGYMLSRGATTFWERWNSDTFVIDPNSNGNAGMNSFNHLPLATFGDWLYRDVGGLRNDPDGGAGYRKLIIEPHPGATLKRAETSLQTSYGEASVAWREATGGDFTLDVTIPANVTATVRIPLTGGRAAFEGGTPIARAAGVTVVSTSATEAVVTIGSGTYAFTTA